MRPALEMKQITAGKVKFFDVTKGFGFITPTAGGEDIFVHQSAVYAEGFRSLAEGEDVEFEIVFDEKKGKKFASNVTGPNGSYVQGAPRRERSDYNSDRY
jgi:cold shock CspA family protein